MHHINEGSPDPDRRGSKQSLFVLWELQKTMARKTVILLPQDLELLICVVTTLHGISKGVKLSNFLYSPNRRE